MSSMDGDIFDLHLDALELSQRYSTFEISSRRFSGCGCLTW